MAKYAEVKDFILRNGYHSSKYDVEERGFFLNCLKHNKKQLNAEELKAEKTAMLKELLTHSEQ